MSEFITLMLLGSICINSAIEIVNKEYEAINKVVANNCFLVTGVSQMLDKNHYFSVIPNPANDVIQLTGYTKMLINL
jgi:hypothetical protein